MTTQSYPSKLSDQSTQPLLVSILNRLKIQLERLEGNTSAFENFSHKLQNTNFPRVSEDEKSPTNKKPEEGFLSDLELMLSRIDAYNNRMDDTIKKLSGLL